MNHTSSILHVRYRDDTRVINSHDTFELRAFSLLVQGELKRKLCAYHKRMQHEGTAWYQTLEEVIEKGINECYAMAAMDMEVDE